MGSALHSHFCHMINFLVSFKIHDFVSLVSLVVIVSLFRHCEHKHKYKWCEESKQKADSQRLKELRNRDHKEEQVEEELELVE